MAIAVKKLDEQNGVVRYLVKGCTATFANAVRRSIMLHTPCLAIEDVSIYENDSVMFDEFLAQRLGLLPVRTDAKGYKLGDKVKMVLEKEGPCTVYSGDIKSTDSKIDIVEKDIPITKLLKGQRLRLEMQAVMQTGESHAKWQPAIVGYREVPELAVSKDCNGCGDCIKACPSGILEMKGKKVSLAQPMECSLCGACVDGCSKVALKLDYDAGSFIFMLEPITGLGAKDILDGAVQSLLNKSKEYTKALQKAK